jgi:hypothetical protein
LNQRYWILDTEDEAITVFGEHTVSIVDEESGGIIAYVHSDNAQRIVDALNSKRENNGS